MVSAVKEKRVGDQTIVEIGSREGGENGVISRAGEGRGQVTINSFITWVTFKEIVVSDLGASMKTPSDGNLKWACTVGSNMSITLTFVALGCRTNLEKNHF